jgi:hypothetical protein
MVNCFIEIRKATLKRRLRELHIRYKYQDRICDGVKAIITDALEDFIQQSIEQNRIIEGVDTLENFGVDKEQKHIVEG